MKDANRFDWRRNVLCMIVCASVFACIHLTWTWMRSSDTRQFRSKWSHLPLRGRILVVVIDGYGRGMAGIPVSITSSSGTVDFTTAANGTVLAENGEPSVVSITVGEETTVDFSWMPIEFDVREGFVVICRKKEIVQ